jgi:predicted ArsR family transcriptional regulator
MSSEEADGELSLTDPKAMRAMAHPVRMALIELLEVSATLTATQASEVLGESPANCAFHLRTLAKYGFVREAGGGKGRERPWARAHRSISLTTSEQPDAQAEMAAGTLARVWGARKLERIANALAADSWPEGWADSVSVTDSIRFLTAEEATQVVDEIRQVLDRYIGRLEDPASRPAGALPVQIASYVFPRLELADLGVLAEGPSEHDNENDKE